MTGVERGERAAVAAVTTLMVAAIALVAAAGRAADPAPQAPAKAPVGRTGAATGQAAAEPLPDITLDAVTLGDPASGETITKEALAHRVVLLVFWSRTCDTCKAALPMLEQVYRSLSPAGLVMAGCHTTRGSAPEIRDAAEKLGVTLVERNVVMHDVYTADEVFLTGSAAELIPVVNADERMIGDGKPGPVFKKLLTEFHEMTKYRGTPVYE